MMVNVRFKRFAGGSGVRPKMRVLIADDQPSVRSALKLVLEQQGIVVAGLVSAPNKQLRIQEESKCALLYNR
jgi:DNA-binding NarL/FixJ family response regulator